MERLGFIHYFNFLDHAGMEEMLASENGDKLLELARNISVCLHEDWKKNLVRENGEEYQHFRPVKDSELAKRVLSDREKYLSLTAEDGKPLFKIDETIKDGKISYDVQFDLIRVPFENLTKKWQEANLEAAKFALCLVNTATKNGALNTKDEELFLNFEGMSHDVHLEWMFREGEWAAPELLLPYEYLTVDTDGYNQKDKDRAHVVATTAELTFQPNILARNRSIVIRAINELFKGFSNESGLNPEIMQNISELQKFIDDSNKRDYELYLKIKEKVIAKATSLLEDKSELTFEDLEKLANCYFEAWKVSAKHIGELPKEIDVSYDNIVVDDPSVNHKNIARIEVSKILMGMVKDKSLSSEIMQSIENANNALKRYPKADSPLGKRIVTKNETDYADYLVAKQNSNN